MELDPTTVLSFVRWFLPFAVLGFALRVIPVWKNGSVGYLPGLTNPAARPFVTVISLFTSQPWPVRVAERLGNPMRFFAGKPGVRWQQAIIEGMFFGLAVTILVKASVFVFGVLAVLLLIYIITLLTGAIDTQNKLQAAKAEAEAKSKSQIGRAHV